MAGVKFTSKLTPEIHLFHDRNSPIPRLEGLDAGPLALKRALQRWRLYHLGGLDASAASRGAGNAGRRRNYAKL